MGIGFGENKFRALKSTSITGPNCGNPGSNELNIKYPSKQVGKILFEKTIGHSKRVIVVHFCLF